MFEGTLEKFSSSSRAVQALYIICGIWCLRLFNRTLTFLVKNSLQSRRYASAKLRRQNHCNEVKQHLRRKICSISSETGNVTSLPLQELVAKIHKQEVSVHQVLSAFQAKALVATDEVNCVSEFVPEAEAQAEYLDTLVGDCLLPLHGLPVSVKDNIAVKGYDQTLGLGKNLDRPASMNASVVQSLVDLGAIVFCRTNVPQGLMSYCCSNDLYGETSNPYDKARFPGGSSGGEAALLALGGSVLGVGSDIGGSLRVPCSFCGLVTLKPTKYRLSAAGLRSMMTGMVGVNVSPGFMTRTVTDQVFIWKTLISSQQHQSLPDLTIPPLKWDDDAFSKSTPLKIGFYIDDGYFPVTPGCRRAVLEAKALFEAAGHQVVPFSPPDVWEGFEYISDCLGADGGRSVLSSLRGETPHPALKLFYYALHLPKVVRVTLKPLINLLSKYLGSMVSAGSTYSYEYWNTLVKRERFIRDFTERWRSAGIDLCLLPVLPFPALTKDMQPRVSVAGIGTMIYNLLDFPAGVVPVTTYNEQDEKEMETYPTTDRLHYVVKKGVEGAVGLPLAIQLVGLPWREEVVLRGMKELEDARNLEK